MSENLYFEFALHDPATAIAPVFLALQKGKKATRDVTTRFSGAELQWHEPAALGISDQSVFLGLLSIAAQQKFQLRSAPTSKIGKDLLAGLQMEGHSPELVLAVLKTSWKTIALAAGYQPGNGKRASLGGNHIALVRDALTRLATTTIRQSTDGKACQSQLLSWTVDKEAGVNVALNFRSTQALRSGQFTRISLEERHALPSDAARALHAYLSGSLRRAHTRKYTLDTLQAKVWGDSPNDKALSKRKNALRFMLAEIERLPTWKVSFLDKNRVEIERQSRAPSVGKPGNKRSPQGTIGAR